MHRLCIALDFYKELHATMDFGETHAKLMEECDEIITAATLQIGASAACVAIYVTAAGTCKASTKASTIKKAKKTIDTSMPTPLPLALTKRLQQAINSAEEAAKAEVDKKDKTPTKNTRR